MRNIFKLNLVFLLLFIVFGCNSGLFNEDQEGLVDIGLQITIPNFEDPLSMEQSTVSRSLSSRTIAPQTQYINVKVSGNDFADIEQNFEKDVNTDFFSFNTTDGYGYCDITIPGIPTGLNRTITVTTYDSLYTPLTGGSTTKTINLNESNYSLSLVPVNTTKLNLDTPISGMVAEGEMKYYSFQTQDGDYSDNQKIIAELSSQNDDVDLYLYRSTGYISACAWRYDVPPIDEAIIFTNSTSIYYIGVYGSSSGDSSFELKVSFPDDEEFAEYYTSNEITPSTFSSIDGDAEQLYPGSTAPFAEINLVSDFNLYFHGTSYNNLYVSPNGYLSFLKYNNYYYWYDSASSWSSWSSWYPWWGGYWNNYYDPNDIIALYMCPLYFPEDDSKLIYKLDEVIGTDGGTYDQLIIEYHNMYHRKDDVDSSADRYITGQIIITEGKLLTDGSYEDATVELRYDRTNTVMDAIPGFIGLKNSNGKDRLGPEGVNGMDDSGEAIAAPINDYEFHYKAGSINVILS